jgi:uncharacterized protein
MVSIGLLSDTHGYFDPLLRKFFAECDEIWHAGDIGNMDTLVEMESFKPLRAVYGNIDGADIRAVVPLDNKFSCERVKVWLTHIGGYPGNYDQRIRKEILTDPPQLFISGHSHICKVIYDKDKSLLHINPGAAGKYGFHKVRTAIRFKVSHDKVKDLEIYELGQR